MMSTSIRQYPPCVQVANTYYYPGAKIGTVSDGDIAALASKMRSARIEREYGHSGNHQFLLKYEIPRSALAQDFSDPAVLPGTQVTPAQVPDACRPGTAAHLPAGPHPASHLPTPPGTPSTSPNHRGRNGGLMQPPVRLHLNPNRPRRFHPDERGTAKEQRIRRVANQESINLFGGENGRRLLTQLWASIPRQAPLQLLNTNVPVVSPVQALTDRLNGMSINPFGTSQMYTVPAPGRIARHARGVFPPPRRARRASVANPTINSTEDKMETEFGPAY